MRSWSVKTVVTALSIVISLTIAVPADARPAQTRDTAAVSDTPRGIDRVARAVRRLLNRLGSGITANNLPTVPFPDGPANQ
jgi:hypothetical protein